MSKVHYMNRHGKAACNQPPPPFTKLNLTKDDKEVTCKGCHRVLDKMTMHG